MFLSAKDAEMSGAEAAPKATSFCFLRLNLSAFLGLIPL